MTATAERLVERPGPSWIPCPHCHELTYSRRFTLALRVCPGCGWHSRLTAPERLEQLLDPGSATAVPVRPVIDDPLEFVDRIPYRERLASARATTGLDEAMLCVRGRIAGHRLVVAAMDFRFLGGSLGCGVGERLVCATEVALDERIPLLIVTASGGARMQEGALALMQMAKASQSLVLLDEAGLPTISLVTDPTYGGVAASFATLTDVIIAEPGAHIGFAGPRVIEQTIGRLLPDGFQTAEFSYARGLIDAVVPRAALRATLARLLSAVRPAEPAGGPDWPVTLIRRPDALPAREPWQVVRLARTMDRPTTLDYIGYLLDEFHELHGDRATGDCAAIVGGPGRIGGLPVMVIGHQKGHDATERVARNFGMAAPAGYRKAHRLMRLAEKLRLPVVTLVDTPGAHPGLEAEEGGQAWAIAENLRLMARLAVPIVSVITGEGGSGGALALAVADRVLALENATYSVISPEGCAAILWKNQEAAPQAAAALRLGAADLLRHGIVDAVVPEPPGGAHVDPVTTARNVRTAVCAQLTELIDVDADLLVAARRRRFGRIGGAA